MSKRTFGAKAFFQLLISVLAFTAAVAQQKPTTTINATSTVHDTKDNTVGSPLLNMRSDDYNEYPQATYTNTGKVSSIVNRDKGSWQLFLGSQSLRTIFLTLSQPAPNSPPAPTPDGYYSANVEVYSRCWDFNNPNQETGLLAIQPGSSNNYCNLGVDFSYAGIKYKLEMSPKRPGTGWATVSCNGGSGGACNNWTIAPNTITDATSGNIATVANLYRFDYVRGQIVLVYLGSYYNTYRIDVTNP